MREYLVPALPGLAALGLWALLDLQRFICVAVLAAMILPNTLISPGGTQVALADLLLVIAVSAWVVGNAVGTETGPWLARNPLAVPLLLFVGINVGSIGWSQSPHSTGIFAIQIFEIAFVLPIIFGSVPKGLDVIRNGQRALIVATAALGVAAMVKFIPRAAHGDTDGVYLWGIHKNATGSFVAAGLVLAYAWFLQSETKQARRLYAFLMLCETAGLVASVSRGAMLGAIVGFIAVSVGLRKARVASLIIVALAAVTFLTTVGIQSAGVKKDASGAYDSSVVRKYSFSNAIPKIEEKPVLGLGAGAYFDSIPQLDLAVLDPQNIFLLTWAETGIIGLAALLYVLYSLGRLLVRIFRLPPEYAGPGVAAAGVFLTFLVHVQVDETWIRGQASLGFAMVGLMVATERLALAHRVPARTNVPRTARTLYLHEPAT